MIKSSSIGILLLAASLLCGVQLPLHADEAEDWLKSIDAKPQKEPDLQGRIAAKAKESYSE
ncbi:MAG: hypothetical protein K2X27_21435, partial [Candidatus Obscuribacterales bacterium]|nr:hypothetical protein [Candidatus Obscuribacterales bacterium]